MVKKETCFLWKLIAGSFECNYFRSIELGRKFVSFLSCFIFFRLPFLQFSARSSKAHFFSPGARSLPLTPPAPHERPLVAISCPDGLAHALSEQNIRLQQIVQEHKVANKKKQQYIMIRWCPLTIDSRGGFRAWALLHKTGADAENPSNM